ncbi:hypothetical protein HBH98_007900 [Parastagonospora nodorum]|nr:hypothetical protein HBH98_007900 [Parastagonospora nodorum]KAH4397688.1 hypothetical protein HBH97_007040 [Parastagonospora nodorum]KAH4429452.1 hypothetical protein HBH99_007960 [Parastagonospora nodorum]
MLECDVVLSGPDVSLRAVSMLYVTISVQVPQPRESSASQQLFLVGVVSELYDINLLVQYFWVARVMRCSFANIASIHNR